MSINGSQSKKRGKEILVLALSLLCGEGWGEVGSTPLTFILSLRERKLETNNERIFK
jgi:hypothetical protein